MLLSTGQIVLGLVLLYFGAEGLVRGSSSLASRFRISPLVIGLTIVAFGTSAPELVVSLKTAMSGNSAISIGNVIGSNIFNIGVILGISGLIYPLRAELKLVRLDAPIMIGVALLFGLFFLDNRISRLEGLVLFIGVVLFTFSNFYVATKSRSATIETQIEQDISLVTYKSIYTEIVFIGIGLALLVFGADMLVKGSIVLAKSLGMSEAMIGLTIVAAGTSLPELATSIVAATRKNPDIAIGNVVGSNIFNILSILGITALVHPIESTGIQLVDYLFMLGLSIVLLPIIWTKYTLQRLEGLLLFSIYIVYFIMLLH